MKVSVNHTICHSKIPFEALNLELPDVEHWINYNYRSNWNSVEFSKLCRRFYKGNVTEICMAHKLGMCDLVALFVHSYCLADQYS